MQKLPNLSWRPRIDHLALATPDLKQGIEYIEDLLRVFVQPGGRHPAWGTRNVLVALGAAVFLEIIAPDPERPDPAIPSLFGIDQLSGPGLTAWAVRENRLEARLEKIRQAGIRFGPIRNGRRQKPDGTILHWQLSDPLIRVGDGVIPFLIDWRNTPHPAGQMPQQCSLLDFRIEHPRTLEIARILHILELDDLRLDTGNAPGLIATIQTPSGPVELR